MKICFVVQRYGVEFVGGAERYVRAMAGGLAAEGHDISVVTSCATSYHDWADEYPAGSVLDEGVVVHRLPVTAPRDNERFIPLHLRAVDVHQPPLWPWAQERWSQLMGPDLQDGPAVVARAAATHDVTILVGYHYSQTMRLTLPAAAFGPTIVIPTAHPEGAFHVGRVGAMFEHADHVISLAPEEAELIRRTYDAAPQISVVGCPVDPIVAPSEAEIDAAVAAVGARRGRYAIVVGRVDPAKGSDDAIRFTQLYRRNIDPDFELVVVGPGGDGARTDGVRSTGFVDEATKNALIAGSGVLLQPSYMESFSLALMEGWLLGRPALVQRRSEVLAGHAERSGGGLTYGDYLDFEAAMVLLTGSPDISARLGRAGCDYVEREYAWDHVRSGFLHVASGVAEVNGRTVERAGRVLG